MLRETWRFMEKTGLWVKNSSLGPGQRAYATSSRANLHGSRTSSPREVIVLPSVQFSWKKSSVPTGNMSSAGMLSPSLPRQRGNETSGFPVLPEPAPQERGWPVRLPEPHNGRALCSDKVYRYANHKQERAQARQRNRPSREISRNKEVGLKLMEKHPTLSVSEAFLPVVPSGSVVSTSDGRLPLALDSPCEDCGLLFSRLSIARHMKVCSLRAKQGRAKKRLGSPAKPKDWSEGQGSTVVARVVTVGLTPGRYDQVLIHSNEDARPVTRTLVRSTLQNAGHGLPLLTDADKTYKTSSHEASNFRQCTKCGMVTAADKISIHQRLCRAPRMSTGTVAIPSTHDLLRVERNPQPRACSSTQPHKPVLCYICGRKYGSQSISIHEPQCLKKFNSQNDQLPIDERLPLPRRRGSVARVLLREEEEVMVARLPKKVFMDGKSEPKERLIQRYLESCYSEFEKELLPCKNCGRTFAAERLILHQPNCNARPLKLL